jgi:hypothetical protein
MAPDCTWSVMAYFELPGSSIANLPQSDAGVRVLDNRDTAVDTLRLERLLVKDAEVHHLGLVWDAELLEDDRDLLVISILAVHQICVLRTFHGLGPPAWL